LFYIIIGSSPTQKVAADIAAFLAKNGVDLSVETMLNNRNELWYVLVSTEGFPSNTKAQPFRDQIVRIGDQLSPGTLKDAYVINGLANFASPSSPSAPPPATPRLGLR
jgi:hypothetical protein